LWTMIGLLSWFPVLVGMVAAELFDTVDIILWTLQVVADVVGGQIVRRPGFRVRTQAWLESHGRAVGAAAGVAALLGRRSAVQIVENACSSFYYVSADKITREAMADSNPNPNLGSLCSKARLGEVDAFLSHSWHDNVNVKWAALQAWRRGFREQNGREPRLWIDKYCIDQNNITESLQCLPVYLSGCSNILILCGETYLTRLWCLVEIFVFTEMGGTLSQLQIYVLSRDTNADANIRAAIDDFDVSKARCTKKKDTYRLQSVMAAASAGGKDKLTELVRTKFGRALFLRSNTRDELADVRSSLAGPNSNDDLVGTHSDESEENVIISRV